MPILAAAALALALTFAVSGAQAAGRARLDTSGAVSGTLVNGTHDNAALAGQTVTLQAVIAGKAQDAATTRSDARGGFHFGSLDTSGDTTYAVYARYQGGLFSTPAVDFTSGPAQRVTLTVYDVTASDAAVRVSNATVLFSDAKKEQGLIPVGEFITVANSGTTAYAGSLTAANGRPMNLLRFALPDGATNLTLGAGFSGVQIAQVSTGFGAAATIPPGKSVFAFAFDIPYTETAASFAFKAEYPTDNVVALVPTSMRADARDFAAKPDVTASGKPYHVVAKAGLAASATAGMGLAGLPRAGVDPDLTMRQLVPVGLLLATLLAALAVLYLRRGDLAVALNLAPAVRAVRRDHAPRTGPDAERERLLRALLALEKRHAAGGMSDERFARERAALRAQLRAALAGELADAGAPAAHLASASAPADIAASGHPGAGSPADRPASDDTDAADMVSAAAHTTDDSAEGGRL
jgi:hypothetical protein